jgi:hypothetical protein
MVNDDLTLARVLLDGFIKDNGPESLDDEREARRALVRLLRSDTPLDRDVRDGLAALFDPDNELRIAITGVIPGEGQLLGGFTPNDRKLTFQFRSRKRRPDHVRNSAIAQQVHDGIASGLTAEKALAATAEKFGVSDDAVKRIWRAFRAARELGLFDR